MAKPRGKRGAPRMRVIEGLPVEVRKNRGQKNLYLRIHPHDGRVTLSAPARVSDQKIDAFVRKNLESIRATQARLRDLPYQNSSGYEDGDRIWLWGEPFRLELRTTEEDVLRLRVDEPGRRVVIAGPEDAAAEERRDILDEWYCAELKRRIPAQARKVEERTGLRAAEYRVRKMRTRWGTCNVRERRVWLSLELARYPMNCLDYILTHELVHLVEPRHNEHFYALVERYCPGWREAEAMLQGRGPVE